MNGASSRVGNRLALLGGLAIVLGLARAADAQVLAMDSAADPAYSDGWQGIKGAVPAETGMDNGGTGFLEWNFDDTYWEADSSPYPTPHFIDKGSSFNDLGESAFAITNGNVAFNRFTTTVARPFAAPLKSGDTMSIELDNPVMRPLEEGDEVGYVLELQTKSKTERFGLYTTLNFNKNNWTITDSRGDETSTGFSDEAGSKGFTLALKLTGEEAYQMTITPKSGGSPLQFEGQLAKAGTGPIERLEIFTYGNGSGDGDDAMTGEREFYFNNLRIESGGGTGGGIQKPGDCNSDGELDISDPICLLNFLFAGSTTPLPCDGDENSAGNIGVLDTNGDAKIDISDVVYTLGYLFQGGSSPAQGANCQAIAGCPDNDSKCERP
jgi:hypothetical protein